MRIAIVRNNSNTQAIDASILLSTYLTAQGIDCVLIDSSELTSLVTSPIENSPVDENAQMIIALGGDGTILRCARLACTSGAPILGINFGRLGFLANSSEDGVIAIAAAALAGDVTYEQRTNLRITPLCEGEEDPWDDRTDNENETSEHHSYFALNEAAMTRGANGRMVDFSWDVSGAHIADMRGDGLVIATATGSTAYALSAGGPLIAPNFDGLVAVPLAPHTLHTRAIVTAANDIIRMDLTYNASYREATLFVDGEELKFEQLLRRLYVRKGEQPTTLIRYKKDGFYERISKAFF